jgi:hypothetical protein
MTQPALLRNARTLSVLLLLSCFARPARADVPALLPIQGYLTDKAGAPLDGSKMVAFRLYTAPTGGSPLHEETLQVVAVDGYFTAYLGDDSLHPLDLAKLRDSAKVFLGIEVEKDGEGVPRLQLASTAFAAQAAFCADATNLGGRAPSTFADASHTHDWNMITDKPTEFPPAPHTHGDADISCYSDLMSEGYLDNDSDSDVLLRGQADSVFANKVHTHDATDITSGTIGVGMYSAYADLGAEGYLGNNAPTDLLSQAESDMRFVNTGENSSVTSAMIVDGTIVAADLAANSVTMDRTSAPLGAGTSTQSFTLTNPTFGQTFYLLSGVSFLADSNGTCVVSATARASGTAGPTGYFYTYPAVATDGGSPGGVGGTTIGYGMPTVVNNATFQTSTITGVFGVTSGHSYLFGCVIYVSGSSTFSGDSFTCNSSWICN